MQSGILINLYDDEKIVLVIRRHWLAFLQSILITLALLLVFIIGYSILNGRISSPASSLCLVNPLITDNLGKGALVIFSSIYLLSVCAFFYVSWLDYYLDIFLVTNKRVLRIEQQVLFGQNISETSLQHVQDVSSKVHGIIYTILDVGTVFIETAGDRSNFNFNFIKNPGEVAAEILEFQKEMWGDEGFNEDISLEKENEKIEKMNTGDPLRRKEEAEKARARAQAELSQAKPNKEFHPLIQKAIDVGNRFIKPKKQEEGLDANSPQEKDSNESLAPKENKISADQLDQEYSDGRKITPHGVIWQSEQEISEDILNTLNEMED